MKFLFYVAPEEMLDRIVSAQLARRNNRWARIGGARFPRRTYAYRNPIYSRGPETS